MEIFWDGQTADNKRVIMCRQCRRRELNLLSINHESSIATTAQGSSNNKFIGRTIHKMFKWLSLFSQSWGKIYLSNFFSVIMPSKKTQPIKKAQDRVKQLQDKMLHYWNRSSVLIITNMVNQRTTEMGWRSSDSPSFNPRYWTTKQMRSYLLLHCIQGGPKKVSHLQNYY